MFFLNTFKVRNITNLINKNIILDFFINCNAFPEGTIPQFCTMISGSCAVYQLTRYVIVKNVSIYQ